MPRVIQRGLSLIVGASMALGPAVTARAAGESPGLSLRMRFAPDDSPESPEPDEPEASEGGSHDEASGSAGEPKASPEGEGEGDAEVEAGDAESTATAEDSAGGDEPAPGEDEPTPGGDEDLAPGEDLAPAGDEPAPGEPVTAAIPPPSSVRDVPPHLTVAIGLGPSAPGTRAERDLVAVLDGGLAASPDPTAQTRRLRPGQGARRVCRDQRDDLVITVGYVADRPAPVLLPYDCALDQALGIRAADAAGDPGLLEALWDEHQELLRQGAQARRRITLGPRARAGIIAGVAIVVVGVAVGALVANALREESVVITVRP